MDNIYAKLRRNIQKIRFCDVTVSLLSLYCEQELIRALGIKLSCCFKLIRKEVRIGMKSSPTLVREPLVDAR